MKRLALAAIFTLTTSTRILADDPAALTHGPMLGMPDRQAQQVWARTSKPGTFEVRYGTTPPSPFVGDDWNSSEPAKTDLSNDCTGVATLGDLKPDTRYYYRVYIDGLPQGLPGEFQTLPASEATKLNPEGLFNFRFQIGSCANQNPANGIGHDSPTYRHLNADWADRVHFHIMNGDWLYEERRSYPAEAWRLSHGVQEPPPVVQVMPTVVGVWENYKLYLDRSHELSAWHRNVPSLFTFDDHELVNDIWGSGTAGKRHRRTVFRDIGTTAWNDYLGWANPRATQQNLHYGLGQMKAGSDLLVDPNTDFTQLKLSEMSNLHVHWGTKTAGENDMRFDDDSGDPNSYVYDIAEIIDAHTVRLHMPAKETGEVAYSIGQYSYGSFRVGNCEYFLLDTRGDRDMQDLRQPDRPDLSMLGQRQHQWLLKSMRESDADAFFVISSVPMMIPHAGAGGFEADEENKEEAWTGFLAEREQLIAAWDEIGKPVFVMTGDLHNSFAIRVTDRIWEFCCGPHNSVNHVPALDEGNRPVTGKFPSGPRTCDIRWSSYILPDTPRLERLRPHFCVVQINNVVDVPQNLGDHRWMAYPQPQAVFQYYDGWTGELSYAEAVRLKD